MVRLRLSKNSCRGEHCSPVQRGSRCGGFGSMPGIDPYTVGADSISARKLCGCRYVPQATNGRPYRAVILLLFPMRTMRFPMYSPWRWVPKRGEFLCRSGRTLSRCTHRIHPHRLGSQDAQLAASCAGLWRAMLLSAFHRRRTERFLRRQMRRWPCRLQVGNCVHAVSGLVSVWELALGQALGRGTVLPLPL